MLGEPTCELNIDPKRCQKKVKHDIEEAGARRHEGQDKANDNMRSTEPIKNSATNKKTKCVSPFVSIWSHRRGPTRPPISPQSKPREPQDASKSMSETKSLSFCGRSPTSRPNSRLLRVGRPSWELKDDLKKNSNNEHNLRYFYRWRVQLR